MKFYRYLFFLLGLVISCHKAPQELFYSETLYLDKELSDDQTQYFRSDQTLSDVYSKEYYELRVLFFDGSSPVLEEDCYFFRAICNYETIAIQDTSFGFIELMSHSKDTYLADGISIRIERNKKDLIVKLKVQGWPDKKLLVKKDYFLNQSEIDWTFEVHNGIYEGFRVQIWDNWLNIKDITKQKTQHLTSRNLIVDSLDEGLTFVEQAYGLKWGVKAYKTEIQSAKRTFNKK